MNGLTTIYTLPSVSKQNLHDSFLFHDFWVSLQQPTTIKQTPFLYYHSQDGWLYKLNKPCGPSTDDHVIMIQEAHASSYGGHFGSLKTTKNLQCHFYWPTLPLQVEQFMWSCSLCSPMKPSNRKYGLYQPLRVPNRSGESISMVFLSGLPMTF